MKTILARSILVLSLLGCSTAPAEDLLSLFQIASQHDARLSAAQARFESVQYARPQVASTFKPQISANVSYEYIDQRYSDIPPLSSNLFEDDSFTRMKYGVNVSQSVIDMSNYARLDQADQEQLRAQAEYHEAQQELITRLAGAYFDVLASQDTLTFSRAERKAVSRQLHDARQRHELGTASIIDVKEIEAQYDLSIAQEASALYETQILKESLQVILGHTPQKLAALKSAIELHQPQPSNIDHWVDLSLQNNFKIQAATLAVAVAKQEIKSRKNKQLPTMDLTAEYGTQDDHGGFNEGKSTDTTIGLSFNLPIYSGGRITAEINEAKSLQLQAEKNLELQQRETRRESRAAYLKVLAGITRVRSLHQALRSTVAAADAAEAGFEVGTRTPVDLLLAMRETFRAKRDYSRARYDYLLSQLELKRAAGALVEDDLINLNKLLVN